MISRPPVTFRIPPGGGVVSLHAAPSERLGPVTRDEPIKYELLNEDGLARRGKLHFRRGNWTVCTISSTSLSPFPTDTAT